MCFYMVANRICMAFQMKAKLEEFLPVLSWQRVKVVEKNGKHECSRFQGRLLPQRQKIVFPDIS